MDEFRFPAWMGPIPRVCAPWTPEEEHELVRGYRGGMTLHQLCVKHGRAEDGINGRLLKAAGENFYTMQQQNTRGELIVLRDELQIISERVNRALRQLGVQAVTGPEHHTGCAPVHG